MKLRLIFLCGSLLLTLSVFVLTALAQANQRRVSTATVALHLDRRIPQLAFAAQEVQRAFADQSVNVVARNLEDTAPDQTVIVLAAGANTRAFLTRKTL
jgi:hypothetical protein